MSTSKEELAFISDKNLRKTIEDAIQYIYLILENSRNSESDLFKEETYRVIVLYVISIIEAILVFIYNERGVKMTYVDYKYPEQVSKKITHKDAPEYPVVIAVQKTLDKPDKTIGLVALVEFFIKSKLMKKEFGAEILEINDIRNTFHFTKPRNKITCEIETVEGALDLLVRVIKKAPKALAHK